jgi:hypothetical protein
MVRIPAAEPTVSTTVAEVFVRTVGVPKLAPVPPVTLNKVLGVSDNQRHGPVQVTVRDGVVPVFPLFGEIARVAVATEIVDEIESVVSVMVRVPVPEPVVICKVSLVAEEFDLLARVAPVTPEMENAVELVHEVPVPVSTTAMLDA